MHPRSRVRTKNASWGASVESPGGTTVQVSSANGVSVKRKKTTTPGGKNGVFHQCCLEDDSCSYLNPCSSCKAKNQHADRNARAKARSDAAKRTNKDQSCDHACEPDGTLVTQTSQALNRSRREQYKAHSVGLNERRRVKRKIIFSKPEWDAVMLMRDDLMRHLQVEVE